MVDAVPPKTPDPLIGHRHAVLPNSLTILGASARAAAFSAARAGFAPHAIDSFADCDLAELCPAIRIKCYPDDFLRALGEAPQAPWIYTGGLENHPRLVERLARIRLLWGNPADVLRRVREPWQVAAVLNEAGIASPKLARSAAGGEWLVKPLRGSAGLGVRRATARDFQRPPRGSVLQAYIDGQPASAIFVAAGGRAVMLGATRQLMGRDFGLAREFLYAGSIGPLVLRADELVQLARIGSVLAEQFALIGLFGVDFIRTPAAIWPLEVNPRYTASVEILERTSGLHLVALHAAACERGELPELQPPGELRQYLGKAIVYASRACRWERATAHLSLADIPVAGQRIAAGHPVVTVFADGSSAEEVEQTLRDRVQQVHLSI
jgi:predicted ATP-grasp superfamily ATP-dependent carboligase